jgi:hypothetical protein
MPGRYTRDELILVFLQMVRLPQLEIEEAPEGVVLPTAKSIQWLQDIIDFWYHLVPFSSTVDHIPLNCTAHQDYILLPNNFILDVRNGYIVRRTPNDPHSMGRILRVPLPRFLNFKLAAQGATNVNSPNYYCIVTSGDSIAGYTELSNNQVMLLSPTPSISTIGELWYYKLPPALTAAERPAFPNDYVCLEYLRIRALEWAGIADPGTAHKFCEKITASMKTAGLLNEPEDDEVPFDPLTYRPMPVNRQGGYPYNWMGPV